MTSNPYGIFANNSAARSIINAQIQAVGKPKNKYNKALQMNAEEYIGPLADYRGGEDTGEAPERHNFDK